MKYSYWNMPNLKCTSSGIWLRFELHIAWQPVWLSPYVEFTVDPIKAAPPNKQSEYHLPTAQHSWREPLGWLQPRLTRENNKHDTKATLLFKASICHPILCAIPFLEYHSPSWCITSSAEKRTFPEGRENRQEADTSEDEPSERKDIVASDSTHFKWLYKQCYDSQTIWYNLRPKAFIVYTCQRPSLLW